MKKILLTASAVLSIIGSVSPAFATSALDIDNIMFNGHRFDVSGRVIDGTIFPLAADHQSDHDLQTRVILHFHKNAFDKNVTVLRRHCIGATGDKAGCSKVFTPFTLTTQSGGLLVTETVIK